MDLRVGSDKQLVRQWSIFTSSNSDSSLREYVRVFLNRYGDCIDTEFSHLEKGRYNAVPPMGPFQSEIPDFVTFLETVRNELEQCSAELDAHFELGLLLYTEQLTKCLIVLCRNLENVVPVSRYSHLPHLVSVATTVLHKLSSGNTEQVGELTSFVRAVIHLCECLYDPYFIWRNQLKGWRSESGPMKHKPAELHVEVIPFFYECMVPGHSTGDTECFEQPLVDIDIQKRLFHLFGAVITGSQKNAQKAICPATVDVLLRTLSRQPLPEPSSAQRHDTLVLKELVLHCLVTLIHVLHSSTAEQRQVEVGMVVEMYFQAFIRTEHLQHNLYMQQKMLEAIERMLQTERRRDLQTILVSEGIFDTFVGFFHKITANTGPEAQKLAMAILKVMKSVMIGSEVAKRKFREKIGYSRFVKAFCQLGEPSKDLLTSVLELVIEETNEPTQDYMIHNVQAALMLIQWVSFIQSHDLQFWLIDSLYNICCTSAHNRIQCCKEGVILQILDTLSYHKRLNPHAVNRLISMVSTLGTLSITCAELKQLIKSLKVKENEETHPYTSAFMHALAVMAQRAERESALHYFDLQTEDAGISTTNLGKLWSLGFSFHAWIFIDNEAPILKRGNFVRRQLYSISTESGDGFEAFFTPTGVLVVAVTVKKKFHSISISEHPIADSQWHSVSVSHICAKGPFRKSHVTVYIDGRKVTASNLDFPPTNEEYALCAIGAPSQQALTYQSPAAEVAPSNPRGSGAWTAVTSMLPFSKSTEQLSAVHTVSVGTQDAEFGIPVSLFGHIGSVVLFEDALTEDKIRALHNLGPNKLSVFQTEEGGVSDLVGKMVLYYNAKASLGEVCQDLSPKRNDGKVKGHKCTTWDIKDVINSLGGIQVLFPLLEIVSSLPPVMEESQTPQPYMPSPQSSVDSISNAEWDVVPSRRVTESSLQKNHIASFLTLLRNMVIPSAISQDTLLRENALATLGLLLQNVRGELIDGHVLMALQLFVADVIGCGNTTLLWQLYQYLIFDFRIWNHSPLDVRKEHIQYLHTIIKDDKHVFRKKYGVQYVLDVIRTYYSSREVSGLSLDDNEEIRGALLGLIHFYVDREINYDELNQLLNFVLAIHEENVICEVLDLFKSLLKPGKKDQIFLLMFEPEMGELLYMLLVNTAYPVILREKVLSVLLLLLKTDKVSQKDKVQLHLLERDMFPGLVSLINSSHIYISTRMLSAMIDLVLLTETEASMNAMISLLQLVAKCDRPTKLTATKKILRNLLSKPPTAKLFAKQLAWQEAFTCLLVASPSNHFLTQQVSTTSLPESDNDAANQIAEFESSEYLNRNGRLDSTSSNSDQGMQGLYVLDILAESELGQAILRMGVQLGEVNGGVEEELCQSVLLILFTIMWRGVEGSHEDAWQKRGQVFAALNYTEMANSELIKPQSELKKEMLHLMLQGCITDLKETGLTNSSYTKNCVYLVRWLYQYLSEHENHVEKYSEKMIEDILMMYDLLTIWEVDNPWPEMEQLGLRILLAFAAQPDIVMCSIAAAKLHTLLQTRPVEKLNETCYVISAINDILRNTLAGVEGEGCGDQYNFLIPVMRSLVEKTQDMLDMSTHLAHLPSTYLSPTFFDDFKTYCFSDEWQRFMDKMVKPCRDQFEAVVFESICASMKSYMHQCHDSMMVDGHLWKKGAGESKLKFKEMVEASFSHKTRQEDKRYKNALNQARNQQASTARQWRATKMFFHGERGTWADDTVPEMHWRLSNLENLSRMRPKLVPNHAFDSHTAASKLRDNISTPEDELGPEFPVVPGLAGLAGSIDNIGDDRLGDDEWNMIEKTANEKQEKEVIVKDRMVCAEDCDLITVSMAIQGRLEVTTSHIYFWDTTHPNDPALNEDFKCSIAQLREIHFRRYNLRRSALEFFLIDQTNYFLNFQKKVRNKVYGQILGLRPPNLIYRGSRSPAELFKSSGLKEKWMRREISNFEYLMHLNTIAGRTYNDLSQYPVFPWILRDYHSEVLDLENPEVFRDLSKPVGVVNPNNEREVREKYEHFEDPDGRIPKFHYGTHYSNAAGVMHYLLRMEPFTTLHIELQSGKFDMADRQFHSVGGTWNLLMSNPNDVKELIPEFFYLPEFLQNINDFDLGKLQGQNEHINNVILPKWAKTPEDFISKHMAALESDHVSAHLHHWIDLIFGYRQKGQEAIDALNVFFYCTYEGAVDLDAIQDPQERKCLEDMINNFGQTPCQLLKEPHPARMSLTEVTSQRVLRQERPLSMTLYLSDLVTRFVEASVETDPLVFLCVPRNQARSILQHGLPDVLVSVSQSGALASHGWLPYNKQVDNFFTFEKDPTLKNKSTRREVPGPLSQGMEMSSCLFVVTPDARLLVSAGHWDNSIRVYNLLKHKVTQHIQAHTDVVTCLDIDRCGAHIMSGSQDTTCMIWSVLQQSGSSTGLQPRPLQILYGHDSRVTCVAMCVELDLAVSGSQDGTVIVHTVRRGTYVRTLRPRVEAGMRLRVDQLALSHVGQVCTLCTQTHGKQSKQDIHVYSINGKHLCSETVQHPVTHMVIADTTLLLGNNQGSLVFKELLGLRTLTSLSLLIPITALALTDKHSHVLVGLRDGKLIVIQKDGPPKRTKSTSK